VINNDAHAPAIMSPLLLALRIAGRGLSDEEIAPPWKIPESSSRGSVRENKFQFKTVENLPADVPGQSHVRRAGRLY
jgi:hypothetical protein